MSFLTDVLHDLRHSKMLPVAVLLLLAVVLVPVFVLESAADQEPTPTALPPVNATPGSGLPALRLEQASQRRLSRLDAFSSKNPFGRPGDRDGARRSQDAAPGVTEMAQSAFGTSSATGSSGSPPTLMTGPPGAGASGGGPSSPGSSGASPSGSSGSPSGSPDGGSGEQPREDDEGTPSGDRETVSLYTHRVDLRFGRTGEVSDRDDVKRLSPLPSDALPLLLFLGASEDGSEAAFLVDTERLQPVAGDGRCQPSPERCTFLYLGEGTDDDQQTFVDPEGNRYQLRVVDIKLVRVRRSQGAEDTGEKADGSPTTSSRTSDDSGKRDRDGQTAGELPLGFPKLFDWIVGRR